jgi:hypothetical protein
VRPQHEGIISPTLLPGMGVDLAGLFGWRKSHGSHVLPTGLRTDKPVCFRKHKFAWFNF